MSFRRKPAAEVVLQLLSYMKGEDVLWSTVLHHWFTSACYGQCCCLSPSTPPAGAIPPLILLIRDYSCKSFNRFLFKTVLENRGIVTLYICMCFFFFFLHSPCSLNRD